MSIKSYIFILIIGFFVFIKSSSSQEQSINAENYTIENGLSQTGVNCLVVDSRGFLWVGTQDGLNKFDGYSFEIFKHELSDSNSLSNSYINCIFEDYERNIWVGTNYGLNKYNVYSGVNKRYLPSYESSKSLKEDEIYALYQDRSGYIWIKTKSYLSRLNPTSGKIRHYEHYNDIFNFLPIDAKFSVLEDHKNQLWVGTKDGLNYFDRKLEIFKRYKHNPDKNTSISGDIIKVIFEDSQNNLWIGTDNGLNRFDWETEQFVRYFGKKGLRGNIIYDVYEDIEGNIWIATNNGIAEINKKSDKLKAYNKFVIGNDVLESVSFKDIVQDKTGIIWAGSKEGLLKIEKQWNTFKLFDKAKSGKHLFSNNYITSIYQKGDKIWLGTLGTGLHLFNRKDQSVVVFNSANSNIVNDHVHKIYEGRNGEMWIGTQDGLCIFNERKKTFEKAERLKILNIFKNNRIYDILEDSEKNLWVGSNFGLHKISKDSVQSFYNNPKDTNSLAANLVYDILIDENNDLWVATEKGLNKFNLTTNIVNRYTTAETNCNYCFSTNEILYLYKDTLNNILWMGTVAGLNRFNLNTAEVKIYTESEGLPNNLIYAILPDNNGNLWMSTNKGISKFNPEEEVFSNFGVIDGLQDFEFNHGAYFKSKTGEFFFGGIAGFNSFYPDSIVKNNTKPNIEITSVYILSENESGKVVVGKDNQIEVPYASSLITIEFTVLDYSNPEKNSYAYKLEGVEEEWINLGNRRYATFSNLSPGKYNFRVKGANSDNVWNDEGASLKIIVLTPLWRTNFAYVIYIVLMSGFVIWIFRYRTRSLRQSNQELKEKELIAKQIAKQKEELTIKNKNITDSIIYAKRIQEALMPSMDLFRRILPVSFILHKAKDIVSGDFYWINERNDKIFIAIVDCTGHGVPGAFMSIIGFELLRNITDEHGIDEADKILRNLNSGVARTFGKSTEKVKLKDGMDIALCVIDKEKAELEFAGAFRPLYFIRDNKIEEIRGDRFSVGLLSENESTSIAKTSIKLKKNDIFYLFTDGYADQFGGPEGKKYKYRRFRHLLLTIHKLPLSQQLTYFERSFEDWKGDHEQVDDVLILGFRPELE